MQISEGFESGSTALEVITNYGSVQISSVNPINGGFSAQCRADAYTPTEGTWNFTWGRVGGEFSPTLQEVNLETKLRVDYGYSMTFIKISALTRQLLSFGIQYFTRDAYLWVVPTENIAPGINFLPGTIYKVKVYLKLSSGAGLADGIVRLWINDILRYENTALDTTDPNPNGNVISGFSVGVEASWNTTSDEYVQSTIDDIFIQYEAPPPPPPTSHNLTINSSPEGIPFIVRGQTTMNFITPWSGQLEEGVYGVEMPSNVLVGIETHNFVQWEDGSTNPTRAVNLLSDLNLFAAYQLQPVTAIEVHAFYNGVEVTADGLIKETGLTFQTPATVEVTPGLYTVRLTYGGVTREYSVAVSDGQTVRVDGQITPPPIPQLPGLLGVLLPFVTGLGLIFIGRR